MKKHLLVVLFSLSFAFATNLKAQVLYSNTLENGNRYNPGFGASNTPVVILDEILIPSEDVAAGDSIIITKVKLGIRQLAGAPATDVNIYYSIYDDTSNVDGDPSNWLKIPPVLLGTVSIAANTTTASITNIVSLGDSVNALFKIKTDTGRLFTGYQTFFLGLSLSNEDANLGWRFTDPDNPSPNADAVWLYDVDDANPRFEGNFGTGAPSATFYAEVFGKSSNTLPVTFMNFDGSVNNNQAFLKWSTSNEINNKGFEVERSLNGQTFATIGFVNGAGSSSQTNHYTYTDNKIVSGSNFYRLKQVDKDGHFKYSSTIKLYYSHFDWALMGNPSTNNSWMQLQLDKNSNVSLQIVSVNGNTIQTINKGNLTKGTYSIPMLLTNSAPGMYVVKLIVDNKTYTKKLIK